MIHPRLLEDCHTLGPMSSGLLLLNRNAAIPWFILVPDTDRQDLLDLDPEKLDAVMADCRSVSRFLKERLDYTKVNFAGLGNVVPQMHLHIIGRREDDPCWPQPVWGNLAAQAAYTEDTLSTWQRELHAGYGLREGGVSR